ncbi:hypothetical protein [Clostridium sp. UBA1353]|uniref:hypothetical protein n=1 Tax=Clostridium sp. UBA1353 TaxID=1946347 RepID=UPI0032177E7D
MGIVVLIKLYGVAIQTSASYKSKNLLKYPQFEYNGHILFSSSSFNIFLHGNSLVTISLSPAIAATVQYPVKYSSSLYSSFPISPIDFIFLEAT